MKTFATQGRKQGRRAIVSKAQRSMASLIVAVLVGLPLLALRVEAVELLNNSTVGNGATDEHRSYDQNLVLDSGTLIFGSAQDKAGSLSTSGQVTLAGGSINVNGSGTKISGALEMDANNDKSLAVVPGTTNTFIPNTDPALVSPIHSITAGAAGMQVKGVHINIGAPSYGVSGPEQGDIAKSWEGKRLDLTTTNGGDMHVSSGDFRVANIAFPIKDEAKAALRFDAAGSLTVTGGSFILEGQPVANPVRGNYDTPSLLSLKAEKNVLIAGGTYDIRSARMHLNSDSGKVIINDGLFNINSTSPYPGWTTFDKVNGVTTPRDPAANTQDKLNVFGSLDTSSELVVNRGVFNLGSPADKTMSYINMANKTSIFNGGTFNVYNGSIGNNKAALIINGGTYNLVDGGNIGGRNFSGNALDIRGGTFNIQNSGPLGYAIGLLTEAAYLNDEKRNKTNLRISGGTFNYSSNANKLDAPLVTSSYGIDIAGGDFVRKNDGVNAVTISFVSTGQGGSAADSSGNLNISGGQFRTENIANYTQGVAITRDDNIRLYNVNDSSAGVYKLHTEASVDAVFAQGDDAVRAAFAPKNNADYLPTKAEVIKALKAAKDMAVAVTQEAWHFEAARNLNVTGGQFDLHTVNTSSFTAGDTLTWKNANLLSSGGGGALSFIGVKGINILSGNIHSEGASAYAAYALQYDNRGKLDRDRWTLGKYLYFITDGDMTVGAKGTVGPNIYQSDGMMFFTPATVGSTSGNLYLYSGSLTLDGQYRSTLNTGSMNNIIDGGTLNVFTHDRINRNGIDSASMWTMPVTLKSGTINLYNSQLGGKIVMDGGTINAMGDSAVNSGFMGQAVADITLNSGTLNLGPKAYLGAIKGDSLAFSPYVTASGPVSVGDGMRLNFTVAQPVSGNLLQVGTHLAGIYTTENNGDIRIADGAQFRLNNPFDMDAGQYMAAQFIEAKAAQLYMRDTLVDMPFYRLHSQNTGNGKTADMIMTIKNPQSVIASFDGSDNVRANSAGYADLLRNGSGGWRAFSAAVASASRGEAAEMLRQVGGETTTGTAQSLVSSMGEFRNRVRAWGSGNISGLASGDSIDMQNGNRVWMSGMGSWTAQAGTSGRAGYDASSGGMAAGFEHIFADHYTLGIALGYARGYVESRDNLSKSDSDTWFGSLYTSLDFQPVVIDADISYANTQSRITNTFAFPGQTIENKGEFTTNSWSAGLKGSYIFSFNDNATKLAPYAGIEFMSVAQAGYSESGPLARSFGSDTSTLWTLPVGVKFSHEFKGEKWNFTPEVGVGYARDLNEFKPAARVTVAGMGTEIKSYGPELSPDSFRATAGFKASYNDSVDIFANYSLDARYKYSNQGVTAGIVFNF